jgi:hypothetical protein
MTIKLIGCDKIGTTNRKSTQISHANSMDIGIEAYGFDSNAFKARHLESSTDKDNADEEKILRIFGKMLPLIEEFDNLLLDIPHDERIDAVAQIIISSLMSSNPFKAMENAINF